MGVNARSESVGMLHGHLAIKAFVDRLDEGKCHRLDSPSFTLGGN